MSIASEMQIPCLGDEIFVGASPTIGAQLCDYSSVVEYFVANEKVKGSTPFIRSNFNYLGVVQYGRTLALGARGRRFKPCRLDH